MPETKSSDSAQRILRKLMEFMKHPSGSILTVEAEGKTLRFRHIPGLNGQDCMQSVDDESVRIYYDPNWDAIQNIESIIRQK
jgi:hypothetical protein